MEHILNYNSNVKPSSPATNYPHLVNPPVAFLFFSPRPRLQPAPAPMSHSTRSRKRPFLAIITPSFYIHRFSQNIIGLNWQNGSHSKLNRTNFSLSIHHPECLIESHLPFFVHTLFFISQIDTILKSRNSIGHLKYFFLCSVFDSLHLFTVSSKQLLPQIVRKSYY